MGIMFANRVSGGISVQHDRSPVAVTLSDGSVRNAYTIKLLNKSATPHAFDLKAEGADVKMAIVGTEVGKPVTVPADGSESVRVTLTMVHPQNARNPLHRQGRRRQGDALRGRQVRGPITTAYAAAHNRLFSGLRVMLVRHLLRFG
jgi:hypothetical protein